MNREIITNEDGSKFERLTQSVCESCKRIELRCKCASPLLSEVITERALIEEKPSKSPEEAMMDEDERKRIIQENFDRKEKKKARQAEHIRVAGMDDEEWLLENEKSDEQRKQEKEIAVRNQLAADNVEKLRKFKEDMKSAGKTPAEIKKSLKALKEEQKAQLDSDDSEEEKEKSRRGRPSKDALIAPMKDPKTGKFYSLES